VNPVLRLAVLAATAAVLFGTAAALASSLAYPAVRARHAALAPAARARRLLAWSASPWLAAAVLVALCFLPSVWSALGIAADHCPVHDDGHVHLCFAHAPSDPASAPEWMLLGLAAAGVGLAAARVMAAQLATWRAVAALLRSAGPAAGPGGLIPSSVPLSVTAGLLRPLVLVSTGLRRELAPGLLDAVLEHERAHARRRDPLRLLAAALLSAAHLPRTRQFLLADLALACEQAADEEAARHLGDRVRVAEAIVAVERLLGARPSRLGAAMGMGGSSAVARVEALLGDPLAEQPAARPWPAWAAIAAGAVLLASAVHHVTETLLGLLAR
jgi:Zn-dependent protease with chaperone function